MVNDDEISMVIYLWLMMMVDIVVIMMVSIYGNIYHLYHSPDIL